MLGLSVPAGLLRRLQYYAGLRQAFRGRAHAEDHSIAALIEWQNDHPYWSGELDEAERSDDSNGTD